jgi:alpha-L-fucosidase 2
VDEVEPLTLWYKHPARRWVEALPIGNGRLGAMVFGGVVTDRIAINEGTLWSGAPADYIVPGACEYLQQVRRLLFAGKSREAQDVIARHMMPAVPGGKASFNSADPEARLQSYLPLCDLSFQYDEHPIENYRRSLDLDSAVASIQYRQNGAIHTRQYLASYPDNVIAVTISSDAPEAISFTIGMDCQHPDHHLHAPNNFELTLTGRLGPRKRPVPLPFGAECDAESNQPGMGFHARLRVFTDGGELCCENGLLKIRRARQVTLLFAAATSFVSPTDISGDPAAAVAETLDRAGSKLGRLREDHLADHRRLFRRVHLNLQQTPVSSLPTAERIAAHGNGTSDPALAALLFQYGRYLLIASSRPGGLPATLQGLWNDLPWPPWGCKWTLNINAQMNYWPAETTGLGECHEPLFDLIESLVEPGRRVAREHYGCAGFVAHHNTDIWRSCGPVDNAIHTWPMGAAWLCLHLWERYLFTLDLQFLSHRAYPLIKEAAIFLTEFLVEAPPGIPGAGYLVTNPSMSPENQFHRPDGTSGVLTYGPTMDLCIIRQLLSAGVQAAQTLAIDTDWQQRWTAVLDRLPPLQIGRHGQLQEWIEDLDDPKDNHRHVSHLFGVYPGSQISPRRTPDLARAADRSLQLRGDGGTGWSLAWKVGLRARLGQGDQAHDLMKQLLSPASDLDGDYHDGAGVYPNLFAAHPPFQIDANFGITAAIAEMLLQSHDGEIELLPALPGEWSRGSVTGLIARGGITIDICWDQGKLQTARLTAATEVRTQLRCGERTKRLELKTGQSVSVDAELSPSTPEQLTIAENPIYSN